MLPDGSPLSAVFLEGWREYQRQLVRIIGALTPEHLAERTGEALHTTGAIATHLVSARTDWFAGILEEAPGDAEIAAIRTWEDAGQPIRTGAELARGLEVTWAMIDTALHRWTPVELAIPIVLPWVGPEHPVSRAWVTWHILEHDLHHGGEIALALGIQGLSIELPPGPPKD